MAKKGKARVLQPDQIDHLFDVIQKHRHPEKNAAIMQVSFSLGLRAQEISLLEIKEVATLGPASASGLRSFKLKEILKLPSSYTKGSNPVRPHAKAAKREVSTLKFTKKEFAKILKDVAERAKAGLPIDPESHYPEPTKRSGESRDLPMADESLREALIAYLEVRLKQDPYAKPSDPLFLSQKGVAYSPNTLQKHMRYMLTEWAGVEGASSHSGRRTFATDIIHGQGKPVKVAQLLMGHKSAATTIIYTEPPEKELASALSGLTYKRHE